MLDREACRRRVRRLLEAVREEAGSGNLAGLPQAILLSRPEHLLYLANVAPLPTTLNHRAPSFLLLYENGSTTLFTDNWFGPPPENAADEVVVTEWYNMKMPARLRIQAVAEVVREHLERCGIARLAGEAGALPASMVRGIPQVLDINPILLRMREIKDADEVQAIRVAVHAAEQAQAACRAIVRPGIREIDVLAHLLQKTTEAAGRPIVLLCDLVSGERSRSGGGSPTERVLQKGDLLILDSFPVVDGYRADITNTLSVDGHPTAAQEDAFQLVLAALQAAERLLCPGVPVSELFYCMDETFRRPDSGWRLIHHGGHGFGLEHPEPPHIVPDSDRVLEQGMVIALEPGLYHESFGGIRLENNYLIDKGGYVKLSHHHLGLK